MDILFTLLDLVFDNFFTVIILLGIISYLRNKVRGTKSREQQPRRNTMPPFGGDHPFPPLGPFGNARGTELPQTLQREPELSSSPPPESLIVPVATVPAEERAPGTAAPSAVSRRPANSGGVQANAGLLHARNAREGMIWAEVYGQPRALRPHATNRRVTKTYK